MTAPNFPGKRFEIPASAPLKLDSGVAFGPVTVAYQTYGAPNADKSNAILVCHALTGDQFVAEPHPVTGKPGWWEAIVGPGKLLDTDRYWIVCANVLGGCMGSTGPKSANPATGLPYGLSFPVITIGDMVQAQVRLLDHLGIDQLFCAIGGSMGGMQVLDLVSTYPERVFAAVPVATSYR
ncbi:MAG: alpha/beta fold hydrolase, partial [Tagaea sp.]